MQIQEYVKPSDLEQAYALLTAGKTNRIIGGCTFLRKTNVRIKTAIDLEACGLDYIRQEGDTLTIGAYTSLRTVETSPLLEEIFGSVFRDVTEHLIGVQLRNMITLGAHAYSRYGFSDINTLLLALDAKIRLYHEGVVSYADFMAREHLEKDILVEVILSAKPCKAKVQMMRKSYSDYSIFCLAMMRDADGWRIAAGVRPGRAKLAVKTMAHLNANQITPDQGSALGQMAADELTFGTNYRGSAAYRKALCTTFVKRGVEELADEN